MSFLASRFVHAFFFVMPPVQRQMATRHDGPKTTTTTTTMRDGTQPGSRPEQARWSHPKNQPSRERPLDFCSHVCEQRRHSQDVLVVVLVVVVVVVAVIVVVLGSRCASKRSIVSPRCFAVRCYRSSQASIFGLPSAYQRSPIDG